MLNTISIEIVYPYVAERSSFILCTGCVCARTACIVDAVSFWCGGINSAFTTHQKVDDAICDLHIDNSQPLSEAILWAFCNCDVLCVSPLQL